MPENQNIHRNGNLLGVGAGTLGVLAEYTFQGLAYYGQIVYNSILAGNLGDYGATLAMSCWYNRNDSESFLRQTGRAAAIATYWTGYELLQKGNIIPGTYDPKDILAYWLGSASAVLVSRVCASDKVKGFINKTNPFRKKTPLEEIVKTSD